MLSSASGTNWSLFLESALLVHTRVLVLLLFTEFLSIKNNFSYRTCPRMQSLSHGNENLEICNATFAKVRYVFTVPHIRYRGAQVLQVVGRDHTVRLRFVRGGALAPAGICQRYI